MASHGAKESGHGGGGGPSSEIWQAALGLKATIESGQKLIKDTHIVDLVIPGMLSGEGGHSKGGGKAKKVSAPSGGHPH